MPRRTKTTSRSDPACSRCKNEEDLRQWHDGKTYCLTCLMCSDHPLSGGNPFEICRPCLRRLHTILTFTGPRICDIEAYMAAAWNDYGVPAYSLLTWNYEEEEILESVFTEHREHGEIHAAPPHHRFKKR